jgi:hypothetical protein
MLGVGKQPDRRIDMGQVMFRLRDLRLIGCDPPVDLPALVFQRLKITNGSAMTQTSGAIRILVHLLPKTECLNAHWFLTVQRWGADHPAPDSGSKWMNVRGHSIGGLKRFKRVALRCKKDGGSSDPSSLRRRPVLDHAT